MMVRRWMRLAVVTVTAGVVLAVTAGTAQAMPRCDAMIDRISYDWDEYSNYAAWASINQHDGDWQDYVENMNMATIWATQAQSDTAAARRGGCL